MTVTTILCTKNVKSVDLQCPEPHVIVFSGNNIFLDPEGWYIKAVQDIPGYEVQLNSLVHRHNKVFRAFSVSIRPVVTRILPIYFSRCDRRQVPTAVSPANTLPSFFINFNNLLKLPPAPAVSKAFR